MTVNRWADIKFAPRDGTRVRLEVEDDLGRYEVGVKFWNGKAWVGDTGVPLHPDLTPTRWRLA